MNGDPPAHEQTAPVVPPQERGPARGFTLVELLAVVAIVVILAAMVGVALSVAGKKAGVAKARTQLELLAMGLDRYQADTGCFPEGEDSTGLIVYMALYGDGVGPDGVSGTADDGIPDGRTDSGRVRYLPGLEPAANSLGMVERAGGVPIGLVDPFGNPYRYEGGKRAPDGNPGFDLQSAGPDGAWNTADDLRI